MTTGNYSVYRFCEHQVNGEWCVNRASYVVQLEDEYALIWQGYVCDRHLQDLKQRFELVPRGFHKSLCRIKTELI